MFKHICEFCTDRNKMGVLLGGFLLGTAGVRILSSDDAKKVYTEATAAVLRGKEDIMTTATNIWENCDDILQDAKDINERRAAEKAEAVIEAAAE